MGRIQNELTSTVDTMAKAAIGTTMTLNLPDRVPLINQIQDLNRKRILTKGLEIVDSKNKFGIGNRPSSRKQELTEGLKIEKGDNTNGK